MAGNEIERHPLPPFLPEGARILMLGSFPPPRKRWCMDFFYPNWTNDMWRVWGLVAANDAGHFIVPGEKRFDKDKIEDFCRKQGIALYDAAEEVVRIKDNASDNFLKIVRASDINSLLGCLPECRAIVATGQKSLQVLQTAIGFDALPLGGSCMVRYADRVIRVWRLPSTSRAYPLPLAAKASYYSAMFKASSPEDEKSK